ncbi:MAG: type I methionyl aminopeptidase [bacterium]
MIVIKSPREIKALRKSGQIVARICEKLATEVKPGITTRKLDDIAGNLIKKYNVKPAFLGYRGFPATICTSVNEQVVHGIPSDRVLVDGDIISLDVGVIFEEYCGDMAITVPVGDISNEAKKLLQVTEESLYKGIAQGKVSSYLGDISQAIQACAESHGFSVVRDFVGHGIGRQMHEEPQIPNFGRPGQGPRLNEGMVLALEPMVNAGGWQVKVLSDGWTVVTADGKLSCHFEHMVAITDNGPEILTLLDK